MRSSNDVVSTVEGQLERPQGHLVPYVVNGIFAMILEGQIPLGGVLNEKSLAKHFNVSRGPVREAVKQLQGRGLVTREPYHKASVVDLSLADLVEIFQLREAAEGMSVRLAAQNMSDAELDEMLVQLDDRSPSRPSFDLHVRLARGSGNKRIQSLLCDELYYLLRVYRARSGARPGRHENAQAEHWQIVRAMKARDPDLAESLMRLHIGRVTSDLKQLLEDAAADSSARLHSKV